MRRISSQKFASEGITFAFFWRHQPWARNFYRATSTQVGVAVLIGGNFLSNVVEATLDPQHMLYTSTFGSLELFFNAAFTLELLLNMYGFWFARFWMSGWNIFDFVVVTIGLLTTFNVPLPGPLKMLRMMRAFRVFRLFKRIKSLNKIMSSLFKAIPGVVNAFVILVIVLCIYSILAVEFWSSFGAGGQMRNERDNEIDWMSSRGLEAGFEYWGNFPKAMFTMFQVMTGDSWSEAVARPLLHGPAVHLSLGTGFFFVSYQLLCATILINVVVAVLLEKMVGDDDAPMEVPGGEDSPLEARGPPQGADGCHESPDTLSGIEADLGSIRSDLRSAAASLRQLFAAAELEGPHLRAHEAAEAVGSLRSANGTPAPVAAVGEPPVPERPPQALPSLSLGRGG